MIQVEEFHAHSLNEVIKVYLNKYLNALKILKTQGKRHQIQCKIERKIGTPYSKRDLNKKKM